jgi:putative methyltransferase (TIGR04325 family)
LEDAFQQLAGIPPPGALRLRDALLLVHGRLGTSDLKVLDFGGALGHHCLLVRRLLPADLRLRWMVWETPAMCAVGREHVEKEKEGLSFISSAEEITGRFSFVLASGSLQYVARPWDRLRMLRGLAPWMMVDRLPLVEADEDRLTVQRVPPWIYRARYPAWFLSRDRWNAEIAGTLERSWDSAERVWLDGRPIMDRGFLFTNPCSKAVQPAPAQIELTRGEADERLW